MKPWAAPEELLDLNNDGTVEDWEVDEAIGDEFTLKTADGTVGDSLGASGIPSFFYAVVLPPFYDASTGETIELSWQKGSDRYRENIATCQPAPVGVGDSLLVEPDSDGGNMVGPTQQGAEKLCGELVNTDCNPSGTYSHDGKPGVQVIAPFWDSDIDPIGRKSVGVTRVGAFRLLRVYPQDKHSVVVGRFERMIADGTVSGQSSTVVRTILVR